MKTLTQKVLIVFSSIIAISCARSQIKEKHLALRPSKAPIEISDDLGYQGFAQDISKFMEGLKRTSLAKQSHTYQGKTWYGSDIISSYLAFSDYLKTSPGPEDLQTYIQNNFVWMEVYGTKSWADVFVTSYFEPVYQGSLKKTKTHSHALYLLPKDLVQIDLIGFSQTHPQLEPYLGYIAKGQPGPRTLTGRIDKKTNMIRPYFSREEIVEQNKLAKRNLEIVWLDPIDNFFLQIQGSGTIQLPNKSSVQVGYAGQNGHSYNAIGKFVTDKIPLNEITMSRLESYLKSLPYEEQARILNQNPSYVFFQRLKTRPLTSSGTEVIDGRTIATDSFFLPKGLIGLLEFQKPRPDLSAETVRRFIFNQDSGGAIRGPGRVDLFWGQGPEAGHLAGSIKHDGRLWFLLPKTPSVAANK